MLSLILPAAMKLIGMGSEHLAKAQERKAAADEAKHQAHLYRLQHMESGWKDEVVLAIVVGPYIASFFPVTNEWVAAGFERLNNYPDWYSVLFVGGCLAILGVNNTSSVKKLLK